MNLNKDISGLDSGLAQAGILTCSVEDNLNDAAGQLRDAANDFDEAFVRLHLDGFVNFTNELGPAVSVFIDTGADICLIKRGLVPMSELRPARQPMRLCGANRGAIAGGQFEVSAKIRFMGHDAATGKPVAITVPTTLLEADIDEEVILSLQWLGERNFDVCARDHGLMGHLGDRHIWLPGCPNDLKVCDLSPQRSVHAIPAKPVLRALDLFCGRKSAAGPLQRAGYSVVTLDNDPRRNPDICTDILEWDYKAAYPPEYFELVVACPPCTEYSLAMTARPRNLDLADRVVKKTLEIIAYLAPARWWLETPRTGLLARRDFMAGFPYLDCDHCQFENLGYQKPTRFFGSRHLLDLQPKLCDGITCAGLVPAKPGDPPTGGHTNVPWVEIKDL